MALRLYLENRLLPVDEHSNLDAANLTLRRRDATGQAATSYGNSISFYGTSYERIRSELIDAPDGRFRQLRLRIDDDCCALTLFRGFLRADALDWCENSCEISATPTEDNTETDAFDCLKRTPISDDRSGFRSRVHPFVRHCIELRPSLLQDLILIYAMLLNFASLLFYPIVLLLSAVALKVQALVNAVNNLCGNCLQGFSDTIDVNILNEFTQFIDRLNDLIIGCGRGHISPYVRDYIDNVCQACGLVADLRSVFHDVQSPYHTSVFFNAPVHKGHYDYLDGNGQPIAQTINTYWKLNGPSHSGYEFLEELKSLFNAEWRVSGQVLYFETEKRPEAVRLDWATLDRGQKIDLCYQWLPDPPPAWSRFEYARDAVDWVGNEARDRWNAWVDFTVPWGPPTLRGERSHTFPFGMARFRDDGIDRDVLSDYRSFPFIGPRIRNDYDDHMLLPIGVAFQPKLLRLIDNANPNDAHVLWSPMPGGRAYNRDYWMLPEAEDALYARFWHKTDPRNVNELGMEFRLAFVPNCVDLANIRPGVAIRMPAGTGVVEQVQIQTGRMLLQGKL